MSKQPKRKFSREFKVAAVKKHVENGLAAREVAEELEINENLIYAWKKSFQGGKGGILLFQATVFF